MRKKLLLLKVQMIRSDFFLEKVSIPSNSLRLDMSNPSDPISKQNPEAPT